MTDAIQGDGKGLRYDAGKNRLDLIPPEWEWALGEVLTAGANKYADRNWELGMDWSKVVGPMRRHMNKFLRGETYDVTDDSGKPGTGCHHLALVAWNALALMSYDLRGIGTDNACWHGPTLETKAMLALPKPAPAPEPKPTPEQRNPTAFYGMTGNNIQSSDYPG